MKNIPSNLYNKLRTLSDEVKFDLKRKGIVVPARNKDGSVSLGRFTIVRTQTGYSVLDHTGDAIVDRINLPQSAVLIANSLALGKNKDDAALDNDRRYGYALFDEEVHTRAANSKKSSFEHQELMLTKASIAKAKKDSYKRHLVNRYEKLIKIV